MKAGRNSTHYPVNASQNALEVASSRELCEAVCALIACTHTQCHNPTYIFHVSTCLYTTATCHQGSATSERFPHLRERVAEVLEGGSFEVDDLAWIAPCLRSCIRCTIDSNTLKHIQEFGMPGIEKDSLFGSDVSQPIAAHLLFTWQETAGDSGRMVGHFDLLVPSTKSLFTMHLPPDVPRLPVRITFFTMKYLLAQNLVPKSQFQTIELQRFYSEVGLAAFSSDLG